MKRSVRSMLAPTLALLVVGSLVGCSAATTPTSATSPVQVYAATPAPAQAPNAPAPAADTTWAPAPARSPADDPLVGMWVSPEGKLWYIPSDGNGRAAFPDWEAKYVGLGHYELLQMGHRLGRITYDPTSDSLTDVLLAADRDVETIWSRTSPEELRQFFVGSWASPQTNTFAFSLDADGALHGAQQGVDFTYAAVNPEMAQITLSHFTGPGFAFTKHGDELFLEVEDGSSVTLTRVSP